MFHRRRAHSDDSPKNESAPDLQSHGTPVEQPSPEVCSQPPYVMIWVGAMTLCNTTLVTRSWWRLKLQILLQLHLRPAIWGLCVPPSIQIRRLVPVARPQGNSPNVLRLIKFDPAMDRYRQAEPQHAYPSSRRESRFSFQCLRGHRALPGEVSQFRGKAPCLRVTTALNELWFLRRGCFGFSRSHALLSLEGQRI
jgi:hypothetical protein